MLVTPSGMLIEDKLEQSQNAYSQIKQIVAGRFTVVRLVHFSKASRSITVNVVGKEMLLSFVFSLNMPFAYSTTGKVLSCSSSGLSSNEYFIFAAVEHRIPACSNESSLSKCTSVARLSS